MIEVSRIYPYDDMEALMLELEGGELSEDLEERRQVLLEWARMTFLNLSSGPTLYDQGLSVSFPNDLGDCCDLGDIDDIARVVRGDIAEIEEGNPYASTHTFKGLKLDATGEVIMRFPPEEPTKAEMYLDEETFRTGRDKYGLIGSRETISLAAQLGIRPSEQNVQVSVRDMLKKIEHKVSRPQSYSSHTILSALMPDSDSIVSCDFSCEDVDWLFTPEGMKKAVLAFNFETVEELKEFKRNVVFTRDFSCSDWRTRPSDLTVMKGSR